MTRDGWLLEHPYLHSVADADAIVVAAAAEIAVPAVTIPDWHAYAADFRAGVPLLRSAHAGVNLSAPQDAVLSLIEMLASSTLPGTVPRQCRALAAELLRGDVIPPAHHGLFRYLSWAIMARYLKPVVTAFDAWRNEDAWLRNYCPTCGEKPAMAQLIGADPGRVRRLSCGCCKTRWRYRRTGCPFCDVADEHRLTLVAVDGERRLRLDHCETCGGYLKTYDGEGSEAVLLADWTSLHLDFIARDRGLTRMAASLYDLDN